MMKVKYIGDISPCKVDVYDVTFYWVRDEVKEIENFLASKLLENNNFKLVIEQENKKTKTIKDVKEVS